MTVDSVIDMASAVVVLFGVVASAAALAASRHRMVALAVLLDFLTAAGLLHLAAGPTFMRALSAAVVLAVRRLITWTLNADQDGMRSRAIQRGK